MSGVTRARRSGSAAAGSDIEWVQAPTLSQAKSGTPLRLGHSGPAVKQLQERLNQVLDRHYERHNLRRLDTDGDFGPNTEMVVRWLQANFVVSRDPNPIDGFAGRDTFAGIEAALAALPLGASGAALDLSTASPPVVDPTAAGRSGSGRNNTGPVPVLPTTTAVALAPSGLGLIARIGYSERNDADDIRLLQAALERHISGNGRPYLPAGAYRSGEFDRATYFALRQFQIDHVSSRDVRVSPGGPTDLALARTDLPQPQRYLGLTGRVGWEDSHRSFVGSPQDIEVVQERLQFHGYLPAEFVLGSRDEQSLEITLDAIVLFQRDQMRRSDGIIDPGGITSNLLQGDHLPRPRTNPDYYSNLRDSQSTVTTPSTPAPAAVSAPPPAAPSPDPAALDLSTVVLPPIRGRTGSRSEAIAALRNAPTIAAPLTDDATGRTTALSDALGRKTFFPNEPTSNANGLSLPPWFNADTFMANTRSSQGEPLIRTDSRGRTIYHELTGVRGGYAGGQTAAGGRLTTGHSTTHFIVHETDGLTSIASMRRRDQREHSVSMFIGRDDKAAENAGYYLGNDFSQSRGGVKWTHHAESARDRRNVGFVSVELVTPGLRRGRDGTLPAQTYSDGQYRDLAIAYVMASHRAGRMLTVVPHRELDRGIPNGHGDPRNFDWERFYREVNTLLGMPAGTTYGYATARDAAGGAANNAGHRNTFPDIYSPI